MDPSGIVLELAPNDKVPGVYLQTIFGIGGSSTSSIPQYLLVAGFVSADSTITANTEILPIFTEDDAALYAGPGSQLDLMLRAALKVGGIRIKAIGIGISGLTAATATITIDGTWTTGGEWRYRIGGKYLAGGILSTGDPQDVAESIEAYITANDTLPVTAAAASGSGTTWVVTLTAKSPGAWGNDLILWQDDDALPAGATSVIAGGSAVGNGGKLFHNGAGAGTVATALATLEADGGRFYRIAGAQNDSTNLGRWRDFLDTMAGPLVGKTGHAVFATADTLSAATTVAQALNEQRAQMLWMEDGETPSAVIAAKMAALRLQAEQSNPNRSYDDLVLDGIAPQTDINTNPTRPELVAALDVGLTPLKTVNGKVLVVRAITTRSLTDLGGVDDGTLDVADAAVPDAVRDEIALFWETDFKASHPNVGDDPPANGPNPAAGIAYPAQWASEVKRVLKNLETQRWITKVDAHPPRAVLNTAGSTPRIAFFAPCIRLPHNHQLEGTIAQTKFNAAA